MTMLTDAQLLAKVEAFLSSTAMAQSRFGREVMGDGALVQHLRGGRSLSLSNANKVLTFMASYTPEQQKAAA